MLMTLLQIPNLALLLVSMVSRTNMLVTLLNFM